MWSTYGRCGWTRDDAHHLIVLFTTSSTGFPCPISFLHVIYQGLDCSSISHDLTMRFVCSSIQQRGFLSKEGKGQRQRQRFRPSLGLGLEHDAPCKPPVEGSRSVGRLSWKVETDQQKPTLRRGLTIQIGEINQRSLLFGVCKLHRRFRPNGGTTDEVRRSHLMLGPQVDCRDHRR